MIKMIRQEGKRYVVYNKAGRVVIITVNKKIAEQVQTQMKEREL